MPRISGQPIIVQRSTGLPVAFGRTDAPGGVQFAIASRCFALLRRTQSLGDAIDRDAPISVICAGQAERLERHGWTAAVAENAGAGLPRVAERLLPLHGIEVAGEHPVSFSVCCVARRHALC
jgi:hypothetical protein